jgi:uncharacterized protein (DUF1499 family)
LRRLSFEEPVARSAVWARRLAVFAVVTAGVAIALSRFRAADAFASLTVFAAALTCAAFAALLAGSALVIAWRTGMRGARQAAVALALSTALLGYPAYLTVIAFARPPIHEASTDLKSPPAFLLSAKAREARAGQTPPQMSEEARAAQRTAYPDLQTAVVPLDSSSAYQLALTVAADLGWRIVDTQPPNLGGEGGAAIEATDRSLFFGFVDDIAIRITPGATQTAIDVRSVSRVGRHDFGANARRVRKFFAAVREEMRER